MAGVIRFLIAAAILLSVARPSQALCVTDGQGPCYRFWKVEAVFVAKILDKVPLPEPGGEPAPPDTIRVGENYRLQVQVVEAFRGVTAGAMMTLFAPDGVCGGVNAENGGELFIYAGRNKSGELWAQGCGVSKRLEEAEDDLAYARSVTGHGPSALVYGDVYHREDRDGDSDFAAMAGVRVRVSGEYFTAEAETDAEGNYAITLPGTGLYSIEVIPPEGFVDRFRNAGVARFEIADPRSCFSVPFQLQSRRGARR
jgi:hypothetical protein